MGAGGIGLIYLARWLDARPWQLYDTNDFWHTSPNFFWMRVGMLLAILSATYVWCLWGADNGDSAADPAGSNVSAGVLVHFEFRVRTFSILPKRAVDVRTASFGLLAIFLSMLLLSILRTKLKGRGAEALTWSEDQ